MSRRRDTSLRTVLRWESLSCHTCYEKDSFLVLIYCMSASVLNPSVPQSSRRKYTLKGSRISLINHVLSCYIRTKGVNSAPWPLRLSCVLCLLRIRGPLDLTLAWAHSFAEAKRPVNLCKPSPCMNEGTCVLKNGSYRCECRGGWGGPHCENREWVPSASMDGGGLLSPAKSYRLSRRQAVPFSHLLVPLGNMWKGLPRPRHSFLGLEIQDNG